MKHSFQELKRKTEQIFSLLRLTSSICILTPFLFLSSCSPIDLLKTVERRVGEIEATGITLSSESLVIPLGSFEELTAEVQPPDTSDKEVIWNSSNDSVASVGSGGIVTGRGAGQALVTAFTSNGKYRAECTVTVGQAEVEQKDLRIGTGQTWQLNGSVTPPGILDGTLSWSSSNETVATISSGGLVTVTALGEAIITATSPSCGDTAKCRVTGVWHGIQSLDSSLGGERTSAALAGDNIYISYPTDTGYLGSEHSDDGGETWALQTVDSAGTVGSFSFCAVQKNEICVSYQDATNTTLKFAKSSDGGVSW